ncbi:MAG: hypothetical protein J6386_17600 [Candidatus Synoicihabitans palmerolidicus]|nr:hypothetical protein [Candidatus Synoicihabitans palmerolidicus]
MTLSVRQASDRLMSREVDAMVQFSSRVSRRIHRAGGGHVLRAESVTEPGHFVAFLVLPETEPKLEQLLANAFSASINNFEVRRTLNDVQKDTELAAW